MLDFKMYFNMRCITFTYLLLVSLLLGSCTNTTKPTQHVSPIKVKVQTITNQTLIPTHTYVATIKEPVSIPLSVPAGGTITKIMVKNGDKVKAGQPLLMVDSTQAYNALQIAQSTLTQAQDGVARAQQVFEQGGITQQKMVELNSQLQQATSMYQLAQKRLNDCTLRAPQDGVIGDINLQVGQNVAPVMPVVTLLNIDHFHVCFDVAEQDIATIQVGDTGYLRMDVTRADTLLVRIIEKKLIPNQVAHTYTVTASIESMHATTQGQLLPGMIGKVHLYSQMVQGMVLPANCIQTQTNGTSIWVVQHGVAIRKNIQVSGYMATGVLVTHGLNTGDSVIVSGYQKLYHQAPILIE